MAKMTVDLGDKLDSTVSRLAASQNVPSSQVVRRALALLSYLEDEQAKGAKVLVRDGDQEKEVVFHSAV